MESPINKHASKPLPPFFQKKFHMPRPDAVPVLRPKGLQPSTRSRHTREDHGLHLMNNSHTTLTIPHAR
ncbi:MAG TPA: hypothetical protein VK815_01640 [Candidatus Acidoferrales bacterium]|jgi:hypothetical protein|nr:hypothetical protein [Candidatus Acidoferrales bacterium]